jgi:hypothetical protein
VSGVIVTGPAQAGFDLPHLFPQGDAAQWDLATLVKELGPRPAIFLWNRAEAGDTDPDGLKRVYQQIGMPRLWGVVAQIDATILLNALGWAQNHQQE